MTATKDIVSYQEFDRIDMRIGRIVDVQPFPRARNPSYKLAIDIGAERPVWSSAQVTQYACEDLIGTLVVCVCNFAPKNIAGFLSEVLVLGAAGPDGKVVLLSPRGEVSPGQAIY
ncbi:MAG: tRNA-binding protein [Beijerinckiaceae bacterium]|nr:tRNA-binding protein [Beijerinckiaceae bacterium]